MDKMLLECNALFFKRRILYCVSFSSKMSYLLFHRVKLEVDNKFFNHVFNLSGFSMEHG